MVNEGIIFKELDKESKIRKTWYSVKWDLDSIRKDLAKDVLDRISIQKAIIKNLENKFFTLDNFDKASDIVYCESSLLIIESMIQRMIKIYPNQKNLKSGLKEIQKLQIKLRELTNKLSNNDSNEVNQLIIRNQNVLDVELLTKISVIEKV